MSKKKEMVGLKFGKWIVISAAKSTPTGQARWLCKCECGNYAEVNGYSLRQINSTECFDCGLKKSGKTKIKHGDAICGNKNRLYTTWLHVKRRCLNKNSKDYKYYGARGISICSEWLNYPSFKQWSLSSGYKDNLTIERINPDKNYSPENCEWITKSENTRRRNIKYHADRKLCEN